MKFESAIQEGVFKKKKKEKSYKDKLLDDPKYVDDWLKYDDENLKAKATSGGFIGKTTPDIVHAKRLMNMYEMGEKLSKEELDFLEEMGYL